MSHSRGAAGRELPPPTVEALSDGVYAYIQPDGTWWINNTGFVAGRTTVLSIDTCATERRTRAYLDALSATTGGREPAMVVNTHHHGDHTNGNCLVPSATVVGHRRCRDEILSMGIVRPDGLFEPVEWGELVVHPPSVTLEERLDLWVDDVLVELHHFGTAAHTTNDVVAWLPEHRILFAGDLVFNGGTPFVLMGSVSGALAALDCIVELEPAVIVPGHGPPGGVELVDTVGEYLRFLQDLAAGAAAAGLGPLEAARGADLGRFAELTDPERLAGNLHRALAEHGGARPGDPIDLAAAFADMFAYNGGAPLRCLA